MANFLESPFQTIVFNAELIETWELDAEAGAWVKITMTSGALHVLQVPDRTQEPEAAMRMDAFLARLRNLHRIG